MATDGGETNVAMGGTFDPIHDGHRALFSRAFELGDVTIGLTSDELATETRHRDRSVRPFEVRRRNLETELRRFAEEYDRTFEIRELTESTGIATEPHFDVLVVSPETEQVGERINDLREQAGADPLDIVVVEHVKAEGGGLISSTRILQGEIDEHGALTPRQRDSDGE